MGFHCRTCGRDFHELEPCGAPPANRPRSRVAARKFFETPRGMEVGEEMMGVIEKFRKKWDAEKASAGGIDEDNSPEVGSSSSQGPGQEAEDHLRPEGPRTGTEDDNPGAESLDKTGTS